jgi:hypothetical protein
MMSRELPSALNALLAAVKTELPIILGKNLIGIYLYGSLTQGAFEPKRSDVDAIVVTARALTTREFRAVGRWLRRSAATNPCARRLQLSFLLRDGILTMNAPACLFQFGRLVRSRSDGNPIIWLNVLKSGIVLVGPPARSFVPSISERILLEALKRELRYLRDEIATKPRSRWRNVRFYRVYAVLTVCRILYSHRTRVVASKPTAARWAIRRLPSKYRALIRRALQARNSRPSASLRLTDIAGLIEFADRELGGTAQRQANVLS